MSDHAQEDGHVRPNLSDAAHTGSVRGDDDSFDAPAAFLRLLLGVLLLSADELQRQGERWDASREPAPSPAALQSMSAALRDGTVSASLRYALVGMLFETEARTRRRLSSMVARLARFSETAEYLFTTRCEPVIRQTPLDPVLVRLDEALFMAMATMDRWSARGRFEERQGRALARAALATLADELLDYLSRTPEVRALIERQGSGMAGEAMAELRDRTTSADTRFERLAHSLLRRPMRDATAETAPGAGASATRDAGG